MLMRARRPSGSGSGGSTRPSTATTETGEDPEHLEGLGPAAEVRDELHFAPLAEHEEDDPGAEEHAQDHEQERGLQLRGHLPDLGVEEQEGGEEQEQGQRADHQVGHVGQLAEHLAEGPTGHGHEAVAGHDEGQGQDRHVEQDRAQGVGQVVLAEQGGQERRGDDEEAQLGGADPVRALQGATAPQPVHRHHPDHEDGQAAEERQELAQALPVLVEAEGELGQEDEGEEGGRPGPDVGGGPVLVDEVGQAPLDEPPLGPPTEVGPREVIHPPESGP